MGVRRNDSIFSNSKNIRDYVYNRATVSSIKEPVFSSSKCVFGAVGFGCLVAFVIPFIVC